MYNVQCLIVQIKELKVNDFFHEIHVKGKILSMLKKKSIFLDESGLITVDSRNRKRVKIMFIN